MKQLKESQHLSTKEPLNGQIELLLTKVGNTTINNTQNIQLNCYGKEDLGHITGDVLDKLIMGPGTMIGKLTELIHFNENKPENMNVFIPNKRGKYIKSYVDTEWKLENKKVKIDDMVRRNCGIIDEHYCANKEKYSRFKDLFSSSNFFLVRKLGVIVPAPIKSNKCFCSSRFFNCNSNMGADILFDSKNFSYLVL